MRLFAILFVIATFSISDLAASSKDWSKIAEISNRIKNEFRSIDTFELFRYLSQLKQAINCELTRQVPLKYRYSRKFAISAALSLLRVTTISHDKCNESAVTVERGQAHRDNYIALVPVVMKFFPTDNIRDIVMRYHESQLLICNHSLHTQLGSKLKQQMSFLETKSQNELINDLVTSFEPNESDRAKFYLGLARYLRNRLIKYGFITDSEADLNSIGLLHSKLIADCNANLLMPYKTLISTYDTIGRDKMQNIRESYGQFVTAYDLCREIERATSANDMQKIHQSLEYISKPDYLEASKDQSKPDIGGILSAFRKSNAQSGSGQQNISSQIITQPASDYYSLLLTEINAKDDNKYNKSKSKRKD